MTSRCPSRLSPACARVCRQRRCLRSPPGIRKRLPVFREPARLHHRGGTSMGNRLSKIYTRTGDDGTTGLGDGSRVPKDSVRVEAYGTVDELNSALGVLLALPKLPPEVSACLIEVQHELFDMGGELCIPGHLAISAELVVRLERT